ncbi:Phosphatidylinositol N-acetylglucosaminyltransferase subunit Q [Bienertia sinuspersici]
MLDFEIAKKKKMSIKCRVWWPKEISSSKFSSSSRSLLLFGWFVSCSPSCLDVVVAFAYSDDFLALHSSDSAIQEAIYHANEAMPVTLQKSSLTVLGRCVLPFENTLHVHNFNMINHDQNLHSCNYAEDFLLNGQQTSLANPANSSCGCVDYDGLLEQCKHAFHCSSIWIQLVHDACSYSSIEIAWIPTLDHLHWNGKVLPSAELHVMIYETPRYGSHHFAINFCSTKLTKCPTKRPKWVEELYHKPQLIDLDTVILAINCSSAANIYFYKDLGLQSSSQQSVLCMFLNFIWRLLAIVVATCSTFLYIVLQFFNKVVGSGSNFWLCTTLTNIFSNTWKNIQVRCHQFLYWPIVLDEIGLRSRASVEYAEKAGLQRHSLWSSAVIDVFLGNFVGYALLIHAEDLLEWFSTIAIHFTDDVLRTGCVWLMGVPAGFKLNTELAGVFGIISLNAIQIWSTLWFSAADVFSYVIKAVALSGILLGMTISVALISDMIAIATFHVNILEYWISLLYSLQIQALTALWRLFRGRKWNPLRQRLDSYEYSVEQHVVGSLLFTPLLLLLPTTSVFYIFFAIMNLTIIFFLTLIEIIISIIHDTPYSKILIWLVSSKRFPSGIWFETLHCQSVSDASSADGSLNNVEARKFAPILSLLHSNIFSFGQLAFPHYKNVCSGFQYKTLRSAISGILTGKSNSTMPRPEVPPEMPWMSVSYKDYWYICYNAVLACLQ